MKKLFFWLLRKYSNSEKERREILKVLNEKVSETYSEQTVYGNVYNYFVEFIMANPFIVKCKLKDDSKSLSMLKSGINDSFDKAVGFINEEKNDLVKLIRYEQL